MQYYIAAIDYPINVGGRPLYSWPAFIPMLFELTVLLAAFSAFFGTLALCGFLACTSHCSISPSSQRQAVIASSYALRVAIPSTTSRPPLVFSVSWGQLE